MKNRDSRYKNYSTFFIASTAAMMREDGFEDGEAGVRQFAETYGVLEKVTTIQPCENACSKAKVTTTVKRRPGASPLLFGKYLMNMAAFVSLEDISDALPPYNEEVVAVNMDPALALWQFFTKPMPGLFTDVRVRHLIGNI